MADTISGTVSNVLHTLDSFEFWRKAGVVIAIAIAAAAARAMLTPVASGVGDALSRALTFPIPEHSDLSRRRIHAIWWCIGVNWALPVLLLLVLAGPTAGDGIGGMAIALGVGLLWYYALNVFVAKVFERALFPAPSVRSIVVCYALAAISVAIVSIFVVDSVFGS